MNSKSILGFVALLVVSVAALRVYSWTWSERLLAPVRVGMTRSQVQVLIGPPQHESTNNGVAAWDYTRSWSRDARVYFDTNDVVWAIETD
ncbi:outer membrane protein assembly factor BamE [bacterium]|nr:outer membrane protein assembly factor BamE [bacterium]